MLQGLRKPRVIFNSFITSVKQPVRCVVQHRVEGFFLHTMSNPGQKSACYISKLTDPYVNLAIEEWLFRTQTTIPHILYLWRNRPTVVIGRNQNPFLECNLGFMRTHSVLLARRRSGGGTVYHDMGNTNYTLIVPRPEFLRRTGAEMVARALVDLDIPAYVNERHDVAVDSFKVSGSAFKLVSERAYHHGTMLIDTDVNLLKGCLSGKEEREGSIVSKGVESVRSQVKNLRDYSWTVDNQFFCEAVLEKFQDKYNDGAMMEPVIIDTDTSLPDKVTTVAEELRSWDWIYGQTPEFTHTFSRKFEWGDVTSELRSRHAVITSAQLTTEAPYTDLLASFAKELEGVKYSNEAPLQALERVKAQTVLKDTEDIMRDVVAWLRRAL